MTIGIIFISAIFMIIGMAVQSKLKSKFNEYGNLATTSQMSGQEIAQKMLRSKIVPAVQISSTLSQWIIMAGIGFMGFGGGNTTFLLIGIILFAVTTLFTIITLPVEFDASARALQWLSTANITSPSEKDKAKDALKWAALTYVVSALASIAMLVQYILIYMNRSRD